MDYNIWANMYEEIPSFLNETERVEWTKKLNGVALGSDAFFPFRDNIDRARLVSKNVDFFDCIRIEFFIFRAEFHILEARLVPQMMLK